MFRCLSGAQGLDEVNWRFNNWWFVAKEGLELLFCLVGFSFFAVSVSKDVSRISKQGRRFGDADSGAIAETRNKIKHHFSFTPLGIDTYKICVCFGEGEETGT